LHFEKAQVICSWKAFDECYTWQLMVIESFVTNGKKIIVCGDKKKLQSPNCW